MTTVLRSMTGYGRGSWEGAGHNLQVELRTVNNRFLTVRTRLPEALLRFETVIENRLRQNLERGSVTCQVQCRKSNTLGGVSREALVTTYRELTEFADQNEIPGKVDLSLLISLPRLFENGKLDEDHLSVMELGLISALDQALFELVGMREKEGAALKEQLQELNLELEKSVEGVQILSHELVPRHQERFRQRIENLMSDQEMDEVSLTRELSILADRADISEELARLKSHLGQFSEILTLKGSVGRKLDFLLQEINREVNTIGSKSSEIELSRLVITLKSVVEKIREQVQNVE